MQKRSFLAGGTLLYALLIATLIALICSGLIAALSMELLVLVEWDLQEKLMRNSRSGLALLLGEGSASQEATIDLYGRGDDSVTICRSRWGAFPLARSRSFKATPSGNQSHLQIALLGDRPLPGALYLADRKMALSLSGRTQIGGSAWLPAAGVRAGYVDGRPFTGERLVDGDQLRSSNRLPEPESSWLDWIRQMRHRGRSMQKTSSLPDSLQQSFADSSRCFHLEYAYLNHHVLKGHVIVWADSMIVVGGNAKLEDICLLAPIIVFEPGFNGAVQSYASDSLRVESDVQLQYPSVVAVIPIPDQKHPASLLLAAGSDLQGLAYCRTLPSGTSSSTLTIEASARVVGEVFAEDILALSGKVFGRVSCREFKLQTPNSSYQNYLYDAEILPKRRPSGYLSPHFLAGGQENGVVKWMY
ncbi:MAG: polymer-forming cytoskeletal protein [Saprospiraceae bacterium]|nr:polymer-forming cytoskeletal protein [Saprospiraceae bacterium]